VPSADTYWTAAADFEALAGTLAADAPPTRDSLTDDVVVGGRLRPALDEAIAAIVTGIAATADGYRALAAECRRRALACQAYAAAVAEYRAAEQRWRTASPAERAAMAPVDPPRREPWMPAG
jgi:hypothetical protein